MPQVGENEGWQIICKTRSVFFCDLVKHNVSSSNTILFICCWPLAQKVQHCGQRKKAANCRVEHSLG